MPIQPIGNKPSEPSPSWKTSWEQSLGMPLTERLSRSLSHNTLKDITYQYTHKLCLIDRAELKELLDNSPSYEVVEDWLLCTLNEVPEEEDLEWKEDPTLAILAWGAHTNNETAAIRFYYEIDAPGDEGFKMKSLHLESIKAFFENFEWELGPDSIPSSEDTGADVLIITNSQEYRGHAVNGMAYGTGESRDEQGIYCGDFVDHVYHGSGELSYFDGIHDKGIFFKGSMRGKGERTLPDGSVLKGNFEDGEITRGKITYPDGRVFKGSINGNVAYGLGTLINLDGTVTCGLFDDRRIVKLISVKSPNGVTTRYDDNQTWIQEYPKGLRLVKGPSSYLAIGDRQYPCQIENGLVGFSAEIKAEIIKHELLDHYDDLGMMLGNQIWYWTTAAYQTALADSDLDKLYQIHKLIMNPAGLSLSLFPTREIREGLLQRCFKGEYNWLFAACLIDLDPELLNSIDDGDKIAAKVSGKLIPPADFGKSVLLESIPDIWLKLPALMNAKALIDTNEQSKAEYVLDRMARLGNSKTFGMLKEICEFQDQPEHAKICVDLIKALSNCANYCETRAENEVEFCYHHILKQGTSVSAEHRLSDALRQMLDTEVASLTRQIMSLSDRYTGNEIHVGYAIRKEIAEAFPSFEAYQVEDRLISTLDDAELDLVKKHFSKVLKPITFFLFLESNLPSEANPSPIVTQDDYNYFLTKLAPMASLHEFYDLEKDLLQPRLYRDALMQVLCNEGYVVT